VCPEHRESGPPIVRVAIGEAAVAAAPALLRTAGLGSCVCVALWDPEARVGGMAHVVLPERPGMAEIGVHMPGKYADTAIPWLLEEMVRCGADRTRLVARYAGGATLFPVRGSGRLLIGLRNTEKVAEILAQTRIPVIGSDTGGIFSRSVELDPAVGALRIRTGDGREYVI
jgi:chemotaxis protein CheD